MRFQKVWWICGLTGLLFAFGCSKKTEGTVTPGGTGAAVTEPGGLAPMTMLVGFKIDGLTEADLAGVRTAVTGVSGCKVTNEDLPSGTVTVEVANAEQSAAVESALKALKHGAKPYTVTKTEPKGAGISPPAGGKTGY